MEWIKRYPCEDRIELSRLLCLKRFTLRGPMIKVYKVLKDKNLFTQTSTHHRDRFSFDACLGELLVDDWISLSLLPHQLCRDEAYHPRSWDGENTQTHRATSSMWSSQEREA